MFVKVASNDGSIWSSADGGSWVNRYSAQDMWGVAYGAGKFAAVGAAGAVATSVDGTNWVTRPKVPGVGETLTYVTWSGSLFVAVGLGGVTASSPDGISWTERDNVGFNLTFVMHDGVRFLATGAGDTLAYSSDGISWDRATPDPFLDEPTGGIARAANTWVLASFSRIMTSTSPTIDGSWAVRGTGVANPSWAGVAYGNGKFVACGGLSTTTGAASPDGLSWSALTIPSSGRATSVIYSSGYHWLLATSATRRSADGGQTWEAAGAGARALAATPNSPPNSPLWTTPDDQTVAADEANTLAWAFNDPDPGDTQSAYNLKRWTLDANGSRVGAPVTTYAATPLSQHTIPAGTLTAGTKYEFQVDTFDSKGVEGPYSASLFLTAGTRPSAPTWLDPANGQIIATSDYTGTISAPNVDASEWTLYADNAGSIDTATILQGPVTKTTGDLRSHTWTGLANNTTVWWSVRIKDNGLWSQPAQIRTPVSYTPPAEPSATLSTDPNTGALLVAITNPASGAGEPGVTHNVVKADDGDGKGFTTRYGSSMVTPNSTWTYWLAKGARDYSGSIQVTAVGDNGTTSTVTIT